MARSKTWRNGDRRKRRLPNWIAVTLAFALVAALYWYHGPADSPWRNPRPSRPSPASPPDTERDSTDATESAAGDDSSSAGTSTEKGADGDPGGAFPGAIPSSDSTSPPTPTDSSNLPAQPRAPDRPASGTSGTSGTKKKLSPIVRNVKIRDLSGKVVFEGDIDLRDTLQRIDAGKRLEFPNDGSVFQNREQRLPNKPSGYYREWVHRTPELAGPGPQRVVSGSQGEAFYTPDHYQSFRKVR